MRGHVRPVQAQRQHRLFAGEGARDLEAHEIVRVVEAAGAGRVLHIRPAIGDERDHGVARIHLLLQLVQPLFAAVEAADVEEHAVPAEMALQHLLQELRLHRI